MKRQNAWKEKLLLLLTAAALLAALLTAAGAETAAGETLAGNWTLLFTMEEDGGCRLATELLASGEIADLCLREDGTGALSRAPGEASEVVWSREEETLRAGEEILTLVTSGRFPGLMGLRGEGRTLVLMRLPEGAAPRTASPAAAEALTGCWRTELRIRGGDAKQADLRDLVLGSPSVDEALVLTGDGQFNHISYLEGFDPVEYRYAWTIAGEDFPVLELDGGAVRMTVQPGDGCLAVFYPSRNILDLYVPTTEEALAARVPVKEEPTEETLLLGLWRLEEMTVLPDTVYGRDDIDALGIDLTLEFTRDGQCAVTWYRDGQIHHGTMVPYTLTVPGAMWLGTEEVTFTVDEDWLSVTEPGGTLLFVKLRGERTGEEEPEEAEAPDGAPEDYALEESFRMAGPGDAAVLAVLQALDCPMAAGDEAFPAAGFDALIRENGLSLVETWHHEKGQVELYESRAGGYLAVLRDGDSLWCAQYVNGLETADLEGSDPTAAGLCFHEYVIAGSGLYCRSWVAFLLDGRELVLSWFSPAEGEPQLTETEHRLSILPLV